MSRTRSNWLASSVLRCYIVRLQGNTHATASRSFGTVGHAECLLGYSPVTPFLEHLANDGMLGHASDSSTDVEGCISRKVGGITAQSSIDSTLIWECVLRDLGELLDNFTIRPVCCYHQKFDTGEINGTGVEGHSPCSDD
jgi:hypothetical protein